jgi:hypothetical protein
MRYFCRRVHTAARPSECAKIAINDGAICQHDQLMPERGIFCFKPTPGFDERRSQVQEEEDQRDHRGRG